MVKVFGIYFIPKLSKIIISGKKIGRFEPLYEECQIFAYSMDQPKCLVKHIGPSHSVL